jgi:hypothetical protein
MRAISILLWAGWPANRMSQLLGKIVRRCPGDELQHPMRIG